MRVMHPPIHRKIIIPWYDSDAACGVLMGAMILVFIFGIFGIIVSRDTEQYHAYGWIAMLLTGLSAWVILSVGFRLIYRFVREQD